EGDGVARLKLACGFTPFLNEATALFHQQQLRRAVRVPVCPTAGIELDEIHDDRLAAVDERKPFHARASDKVLRIRRFERRIVALERLHLPTHYMPELAGFSLMPETVLLVHGDPSLRRLANGRP